jgi:hypothetical protein
MDARDNGASGKRKMYPSFFSSGKFYPYHTEKIVIDTPKNDWKLELTSWQINPDSHVFYVC